MAKKRSLIEMTEEEQRQFLAEGRHLMIASNGHNGWPHVIAMWYVVIDGLVHFTTYAKSQKVRNLQRDHRITCLLEAGVAYTELRGLVIEGTAEVVDDDPALSLKVIQAVGAKHSGSPLGTAPSEQQQKMATKRAVIRVHPTRVFSWDHRKLGGAY